MCHVSFRALVFHLDTTTTAQKTDNICTIVSLNIPGVTEPTIAVSTTLTHVHNLFCGQVFNVVPAAANAAGHAGNGIVTSRPPFLLQFLSEAAAAASGLLGYKLQYNQQGCTGYYGDL